MVGHFSFLGSYPCRVRIFALTMRRTTIKRHRIGNPIISLTTGVRASVIIVHSCQRVYKYILFFPKEQVKSSKVYEMVEATKFIRLKLDVLTDGECKIKSLGVASVDHAKAIKLFETRRIKQRALSENQGAQLLYLII